MATYLITHPNRPTARVETVGNSVWGASIEVPGLPKTFAPVNRYKHGNQWNEITAAYQGAPSNGYTVTLEALLTLTDYEHAPTGTTVVHRGSRIAYTKQDPNQWHDATTGETISDEYMAQRGVAYTV